MVSAYFVIGKLVVGRTGRRQQHDGRAAQRLRIGCSLRYSLVEGAAQNVRDLIAKSPGELFRSGADEVGLADLREVRLQRLDAAFLRLAAEDPEDAVEGLQRLLGGIRVGGLGIVDEESLAD